MGPGSNARGGEPSASGGDEPRISDNAKEESDKGNKEGSEEEDTDETKMKVKIKFVVNYTPKFVILSVFIIFS